MREKDRHIPTNVIKISSQKEIDSDRVRERERSRKLIEILFQMRTLTWFSWKGATPHYLHRLSLAPVKYLRATTTTEPGWGKWQKTRRKGAAAGAGEALAGILWNGYEKQPNASNLVGTADGRTTTFIQVLALLAVLVVLVLLLVMALNFAFAFCEN